MNIFTRIGNWVEKHFPEKMTTAQVQSHLNSFDKTLDDQQRRLNIVEVVMNDFSKLNEDTRTRLFKIEEELRIFKTQSTVKSRIVGTTPDTMTPFASRLKPVQPAIHPVHAISGGNQ